MMKIVSAWLLAWLALGAQAFAVDASTGIDWEVKHRFRVIDERDHDQFIADFNSYFRRAAEPRGVDAVTGRREPYPSPFQSAFGPDPNLPNRCQPGYRCKLETYYWPAFAEYDHGWFHSQRRQITVRLPSRHEATKTCRWQVDQAAASPPRPCNRSVSLVTTVGKHELAVSIDSGDGRPTVERRLAIEVKDIRFIALGDSFASGEGNPHVTFNQGNDSGTNPKRLAEWWDHRCHRSLLSSSAQTAVMLAQKRRDTSVTYVSFACSGGTIRAGLIGSYDGVETARQAGDRLKAFGPNGGNVPHFRKDPMPIQIDQAKELLCVERDVTPCPQTVQPDIVSFTTGGNELSFGEKVSTCAASKCRFTDEEMQPAFAGLRQQYAELAPRLNSLNARHVFLVTYPTMTRREDGVTYCGDGPFDFSRDFVPYLATFIGLGISRGEARNAEKVVLDPLNRLMVAQADLHGWVPVGGLEKETGFRKDRGFCARPSWFHTVMQSANKQGFVGTINNQTEQFSVQFPSGALHPNVFGHAGMRARLQAEIEKKL
jgi:hypothetical protein